MGIILVSLIFVKVLAEPSWTAHINVVNDVKTGSVDIVLTQTAYDGIEPNPVDENLESHDAEYWKTHKPTYWKRADTATSNKYYLQPEVEYPVVIQTVNRFNHLEKIEKMEYHHKFYLTDEAGKIQNYVANIIPGMVIPKNPIIHYFGNSTAKVRVIIDFGGKYEDLGRPGVYKLGNYKLIDTRLAENLYQEYLRAEGAEGAEGAYILLNPDTSSKKYWKFEITEDNKLVAEYSDFLQPYKNNQAEITTPIFNQIVYPKAMDLRNIPETKKILMEAQAVQNQYFGEKGVGKFNWNTIHDKGPLTLRETDKHSQRP